MLCHTYTRDLFEDHTIHPTGAKPIESCSLQQADPTGINTVVVLQANAKRGKDNKRSTMDCSIPQPSLLSTRASTSGELYLMLLLLASAIANASWQGTALKHPIGRSSFGGSQCTLPELQGGCASQGESHPAAGWPQQSGPLQPARMREAGSE
eukprot:1151053-Pelagomonas_calceolata.AAC.4